VLLLSEAKIGIGSFLVPELMSAGHHVVGLSRSDASAKALTRAGAEVFRGDVNDLDRLRAAAEAVDGVIHAAFNHDFSNLKQNSEDDRKIGESVVSSGEAETDVAASMFWGVTETSRRAEKPRGIEERHPPKQPKVLVTD
jgi:putative NADH-flavin reductase